MSIVRAERRRPAAALLLTLALTLLAGGLTACSGDQEAPSVRPHPQQRHGHRTHPGLSPSTLRAPADVVTTLEHVLAARARALLSHDQAAFTAGLAGGSEFRAQQAAYFADLAQLPVSALSYRLDPASLVRTTDGYWATVDVSLRLDGYDDRPVVTPDRYRFERRGRGFGLASVTDPRWEARNPVASQPWDDHAVVVRRGHGVLGIFDPGSAGRAGAVMRAVEHGVAQVRPLVPYDWDGSVVVYALSDPSFLEGLPDVPGGDATAVDALTFPVFAKPGSHRVASMRFVLNPRLLGEPGTARNRLIRHELTHVAMGKRDDRLPVWLSEGLAEWVSVQPIAPQDRVISGSALQAARRGLTALPADETFNDRHAAAHYGIAWWACEAVADGYGRHVLWSLADDLAGAPDPDAELKVLLGISARKLAVRAGKLMLATYDPDSEKQQDDKKHRDKKHGDEKDSKGR